LIIASQAALGQTIGGSGRILPTDAATGFSPTTTQTAQPAPGGAPIQQQSMDPWRSFAPISPGVVAGPWVLFPAITGGAFYDDNVFATHSIRQSDWAGFVRPELGARTAGQNHTVEAKGFLEDRWYRRFSSENQLNGGAAAAATVMPDNDTQIVVKGGYLRGHEDRGTGESIILTPTGTVTTFTGFDRPLGFNLYEISGALNKRFNRWWTSVGAAGTWSQYDTPTINGVPQFISYRNGLVSVVSGRVGYVVAPLTSLFVEAAGNRRDFQSNPFDSNGYRVVGGVLLEQGPGARVKGEAFAGYMYQNYNGIGFQTVSTFTYGGALAWVIAPQWTAVVNGRRNALESAFSTTGSLGSSVVESEVGGRLDYQVLPNVVIGGGATWLQDQFLGQDRTDSAISPLASVKYFATPNLILGFDYRNVTFDSNNAGVLSYYRNVYLFSIRAQI
jgi:hypothetical protein